HAPTHCDIYTLSLHDALPIFHGHEHVYFVTRGRDVHATEVDLEGRYTIRRSGGRADLGGEIREGGEVVSGKGCFHRKARAGDLQDRKSTRLNSSHQIIPYAVF